jgi:hypothetical protein
VVVRRCCIAPIPHRRDVACKAGIRNYPSSAPSVIPPPVVRALWDLGSWGSLTMHDERFISSGFEKVLPCTLLCRA